MCYFYLNVLYMFIFINYFLIIVDLMYIVFVYLRLTISLIQA